MRMLKASVSGKFADFTELPFDLDEQECRTAGSKVPETLAGAAFLVPVRPLALCLAVTDNSSLGATIQTVHYRFEWNGSQISQLYAFTESGEEWDPAILSGDDQVIAARRA